MQNPYPTPKQTFYSFWNQYKLCSTITWGMRPHAPCRPHCSGQVGKCFCLIDFPNEVALCPLLVKGLTVTVFKDKWLMGITVLDDMYLMHSTLYYTYIRSVNFITGDKQGTVYARSYLQDWRYSTYCTYVLLWLLCFSIDTHNFGFRSGVRYKMLYHFHFSKNVHALDITVLHFPLFPYIFRCQ